VDSFGVSWPPEWFIFEEFFKSFHFITKILM